MPKLNRILDDVQQQILYLDPLNEDPEWMVKLRSFSRELPRNLMLINLLFKRNGHDPIDDITHKILKYIMITNTASIEADLIIDVPLYIGTLRGYFQSQEEASDTLSVAEKNISDMQTRQSEVVKAFIKKHTGNIDTRATILYDYNLFLDQHSFDRTNRNITRKSKNAEGKTLEELASTHNNTIVLVVSDVKSWWGYIRRNIPCCRRAKPKIKIQ